MRRTWPTSSRRIHRWRGLAVAVSVLMLVAGVVGGRALLRRIMPSEPPTTPEYGTATLVDGRLIITNPDGSVTVIDPSALAPPEDDRAKVLLASDGVYVANRADGTVARLDPTDGSVLPPVWTAPATIIDVVVDGADTLWVLCADGQLRSLMWTEGGLVATREPIAVPGVGEDSALMGHSKGVTTIASEINQALRFETSVDGSVPLPDLCPGLRTPVSAPAYLVPIACPGTMTIIARSTAVTVDLRQHDCAPPGSTVGLDAHVVVTCGGKGTALVFDAEGTLVPPAIVLGTSGDVQVASSGNQVVLSLLGGGTAILEWNGTRSAVPGGLAGGIGPTPAGPRTSTPRDPGPSVRPPAPDEPGTSIDPPDDPPVGSPDDPPDEPAAPPPAPRDGDAVIASFSGPHDVTGATYNYPVAPPAECQIDPYAYYPPEYLQALALWCYGQLTSPGTYTVTEVHRKYTAHLELPDAWQSFASTCALIVTGATNIEPRPFDCRQDTAVLVGYGDGQQWSVAVQACNASGTTCVTSKVESLDTLGPYTVAGWA